MVHDSVEMKGQEFLRHLELKPLDNQTNLSVNLVWDNCDEKDHDVQDGTSSLIRYQFLDKAVKPTDNEKLRNALEVIPYLADVDIEKRMTRFYSWYKENFRMPEILPGGSLCMLQWVSAVVESYSQHSIYNPDPAHPVYISTLPLCILTTLQPTTATSIRPASHGTVHVHYDRRLIHCISPGWKRICGFRTHGYFWI
jgi:hypothetical protein